MKKIELSRKKRPGRINHRTNWMPGTYLFERGRTGRLVFPGDEERVARFINNKLELRAAGTMTSVTISRTPVPGARCPRAGKHDRGNRDVGEVREIAERWRARIVGTENEAMGYTLVFRSLEIETAHDRSINSGIPLQVRRNV